MGRFGVDLGGVLLKGLNYERMIPGIWAWLGAWLVILFLVWEGRYGHAIWFWLFVFFIIISSGSRRISVTSKCSVNMC